MLDFETPAARKPLWLNVLDPEEGYGILAARPGKAAFRVTIDGRPSDWTGVAPLLSQREGGPERSFKDGYDRARTLRGIEVTSDEAYLYIRLDVDRLDSDGDGFPDWGKAAYLIGIDTYGFDRPFGAMLSDFFQTRDPRHLWPAHFYGREREYIQIDRERRHR